MRQSQINQFYNWIQTLAKKDSVDFDFYGFHKKETKIVFQKQNLKNCSFSEGKHLNLRVLQGEKAGTSYTKCFSRTSLEECYQQAMDSLKFSDKKERGELSQNQNYKDFSAFYDNSFEGMAIENKINKARQMDHACFAVDKRVQPTYSSISDSDNYHFFANSKREQSFYRLSNVTAYCDCLAIDKNSRSAGISDQTANNYREIRFENLGEESASKALKKLNYSIPKTKKYPVIFQSGETSGSLLRLLVNLMSGKLILEGLSLFKDSFQKKVFSNLFSIYDDPFAIWGVYSKPFDGEGFAMEKTPLVKKGVLENYLTSSFFAKTLKVPHTKKADWNTGKLGISSTNLVMSKGDSSLEEMCKEFPQIVVIDRIKGFAGYNSVSGDFSLESEGFLWERGEARPICQFTVSGNIKKIFSNILKISQDSKVFFSTKTSSFLVPDLTISGK